MKVLDDIEFLDGVKVLVRADFNVPIVDDKVADDFRIRMTLPTIEYLRQKRAKVILISHLESNDGTNPSLGPVADRLGELGVPITFIDDYKKANEIIENGNGCFLLENLRFFEGEKANDVKFAKELASLADIYVNEAFSVCHRKHASMIGVPKFLPSYAGRQVQKEVQNLAKAFNPPRPFVFILGGAKFETKLPLMEKFIDIADTVFVGGALATDFFKEKGYEVGQSLVSAGDFKLGCFLDNGKMMLPVDIINQKKEIKSADSLGKEDRIMDGGPRTLELLGEKITSAKFILWNGPLGLYEAGYKNATLQLARLIASTSQNGAESILGGGDTLAAIAEAHLGDKITFMSTGGGAMLEFLAKGTLPGLEALDEQK